MVGLGGGEVELGKVSGGWRGGEALEEDKPWMREWEVWRLWSTKRSRENVLVCLGWVRWEVKEEGAVSCGKWKGNETIT